MIRWFLLAPCVFFGAMVMAATWLKTGAGATLALGVVAVFVFLGFTSSK